MALVLCIFRQPRYIRLADVFVDPVVVGADAAPPGVPAVVLLDEKRVELASGDKFKGLALSGAEFHTKFTLSFTTFLFTIFNAMPDAMDFPQATMLRTTHIARNRQMTQ